jgi:hypothetical protein
MNRLLSNLRGSTDIGKSLGLFIGLKSLQYVYNGAILAMFAGGAYMGVNYLAKPAYSGLITYSTEIKLKIYSHQLFNTIEKSKFSIKNGKECLESKNYRIIQTPTPHDESWGEGTYTLKYNDSIQKSNNDILNDFKECNLEVGINTLYKRPILRRYHISQTTVSIGDFDVLFNDERN